MHGPTPDPYSNTGIQREGQPNKSKQPSILPSVFHLIFYKHNIKTDGILYKSVNDIIVSYELPIFFKQFHQAPIIPTFYTVVETISTERLFASRKINSCIHPQCVFLIDSTFEGIMFVIKMRMNGFNLKCYQSLEYGTAKDGVGLSAEHFGPEVNVTYLDQTNLKLK